MSNCSNSNQCSTGNNIYVSGSETRTTIEVTNNKSRYFAELAEIYKNKAKEYCDNARYYAEQNSDVSMNYVNSLETALRNLINTKQDAGNYALLSEVPSATSDLINDSGYITSVNNTQPDNNGNVTLTLPDPLPSQTGNAGKYLTTDGTDASWGDLTTVLNGKADVDLTNVSNTSGFRKLVELYKNGTSWYKVFREYDPSTGNLIGLWCEQGGLVTPGATVTFLKSFVDTNYTLTSSLIDSTTGSTPTWAQLTLKSRTTTGFSTTNGGVNQLWMACGYIA